jgi:DnaJ-class molecular chaperone
MKKDFDGCPYEILGISPNVDEAEIKRAYRRANLKYHPDKNYGASAHTLEVNMNKLLLAQKAFEFLSDPEAKTQYDSSFEFRMRNTLQSMTSCLPFSYFSRPDVNFRWTTSSHSEPEPEQTQNRY